VVLVGLYNSESEETEMKTKVLKKIGKGMVYGAFHPFKEDTSDRWTADMSAVDKILDNAGVIASQAIVRTAYGAVVSIALIYILGDISSRIRETPVDVRQVVKEDDKIKNK
jgi:hypothetical protein